MSCNNDCFTVVITMIVVVIVCWMCRRRYNLTFSATNICSSSNEGMKKSDAQRVTWHPVTPRGLNKFRHRWCREREREIVTWSLWRCCVPCENAAGTWIRYKHGPRRTKTESTESCMAATNEFCKVPHFAARRRLHPPTTAGVGRKGL